VHPRSPPTLTPVARQSMSFVVLASCAQLIAAALLRSSVLQPWLQSILAVSSQRVLYVASVLLCAAVFPDLVFCSASQTSAWLTIVSYSGGRRS
jgi:predicted branched-subunit amino acid permease